MFLYVLLEDVGDGCTWSASLIRGIFSEEIQAELAAIELELEFFHIETLELNKTCEVF